jgi:hypothetical protein
VKRIFGGSSYANVTATIALIVALGGTSYAAIKLPKNSVTSLQVKDKSLLKKDFKAGQLPAGKQGPPGPAGPAGGSGAAGGAGTGVGLFNRPEAAADLVPGSADQVIQSLALPAGSWVVTAKFIAENPSAATPGAPEPRLTCNLIIGGVAVDNLGPAPGIDFDPGAAANTLTGARTLAAAGTATVVCNTGNTVGAGTYRARSMTAVQASSVAAG